jgi:hypothetical protein
MYGSQSAGGSSTYADPADSHQLVEITVTPISVWKMPKGPDLRGPIFPDAALDGGAFSIDMLAQLVPGVPAEFALRARCPRHRLSCSFDTGE